MLDEGLPVSLVDNGIVPRLVDEGGGQTVVAMVTLVMVLTNVTDETIDVLLSLSLVTS